METSYRYEVLNWSRYHEWFKKLKEGQHSVKNNIRSGWLSTLTDECHVARVKELIWTNRWLTIQEIVEECNILFHEMVHFSRLNAKVILTVFFFLLWRNHEFLPQGHVGCFFIRRFHHKFLPQGQTINCVYYLEVLIWLLESVRKKRLELWHSGEWVLQTQQCFHSFSTYHSRVLHT